MEFEITYTEQQQQFREEVREWLRANMPSGIRVSTKAEDQTFEQYQLRRELGRRLGAKGWLWPTMPTEYGGGGLSIDHHVILIEELEEHDLGLPPYYDSGATMGAPTIAVWGNEEQKHYFLPKMFRGEVRTWQLLTEPEAGSDLASVKTQAIRDGDDYVMNGQKIFVGSDHGADWMWTIAVTDPQGARHQNVSWLMVPADLPGITIQPLDLLPLGGSEGGHKNAVFFDNVRVPAFNLVGGENNGWRVATTHLEIEHGGSGNIRRDRVVDEFFQYCRTATLDGRVLAEVPEVREHMVELFVDAEINRLFGLRNYWLAHANQPRSYEGSQSSYYRKISGLRMFEAMQQALGYSALTSDSRWGAMGGFAESYSRSSIIALHPGATADVQKMIMARRIGVGRATREEAGRLE